MFYRLRLLHLTSPRGVALRNRGQDTIQPPLTGSASVRQRLSGQYVLRNRRDVNPRVHVSSRVGLEELHLPEKPPQGDAKITCSESSTTPSNSSFLLVILTPALAKTSRRYHSPSPSPSPRSKGSWVLHGHLPHLKTINRAHCPQWYRQMASSYQGFSLPCGRHGC